MTCLSIVLLATFTLCGCGTPSADGPSDSYGVDFSLPPGSRTDGAIVFFIDGVSAAKFNEMMDKGELPAIKTYFVDRGLRVRQGVANTPSVTLANMTSLVTGQFPGHHTVVGVNWFDRNELIWRDYDKIAQKNTLDQDYISPNIYEQFPDRLTFSLFLQPHRGATKFYENWTSAGPPFFFGWFEFVDRISLWRLSQSMQIARQYRQFPAVTMVYMLAPDFRAYRQGVDSSPYRDSLRHADYQIGRVLGDLKRAGLLDKVHIALTSDHSMVQVTRHLDMNRFMRESVGLQLGADHKWENEPFEKRLKENQDFAGVLYGSGDRYWAVCLRKPIRKDGKCVGYENWLVRPDESDLRSYPTNGGTKDLTEVLVAQQAVDAIAFTVDEDVVRVKRRIGEVEFRQEGGRGANIAYRVVKGTDPLGWHKHLSADAQAGKALPPPQWFDMTVGSDYPDLPEQIVAYFRATRRAGDIAVFATPGWDFRTENQAGHGGLHPQDMFVPLLLAGPGVPHRELQHARIIDLMPTILTLLGKPVPAGVDGKPLVQGGTAATSRSHERPTTTTPTTQAAGSR